MQQAQDKTAWRVTEPAIMDIDRYLSSTNAPLLEEDAGLCIASGAREMILNGAPLAYMTGAGMRAFLTIARQMQEVGGSLAISGLVGQPRELFLACGMDSLIPLIDPPATEVRAA